MKKHSHCVFEMGMQRIIKLSSGEDYLPQQLSLLGVYGCLAFFRFLSTNGMKCLNMVQHHAHILCALCLNITHTGISELCEGRL